MCWVMPPASPATTSVDADAVQQERLAVVDVAHDGHDWRPRSLIGVLFFVFLLEVAGQQLGFLLLAGIDQSHFGADLGREQLDHVVGQRLRRHDHLALQHQEAHDVAGAAVQLGAEIAGRRAALDDDLTFGHGRRRRLIAGELCRLELFEIAPASTGPPLRWAPTGQSAATGRPAARPTGPPPPPGRPPNPPPRGRLPKLLLPGPPGPPVGRPAPGAGRPPVRAG